MPVLLFVRTDLNGSHDLVLHTPVGFIKTALCIVYCSLSLVRVSEVGGLVSYAPDKSHTLITLDNNQVPIEN